MAYTESEESCRDWQEEQFLELEGYDITCGNECGHFDHLNQCCWLSWWHKEEGDHCNYGLKMVLGEVYTPSELKELRHCPTLQRSDETEVQS